jgi:uncharacterized membrane protein
MTKAEFLMRLQEQIREYPSEETEQSLNYYSEMIDDRMEDGMTEAEAIASLGAVEDIAEEIKCELPLTTLVKYKAKEKTKGKSMPVWGIVLLVLGSPIWLSLLLVIIVVVLVLYLAVWCVALAFWCVDVSFAAASVSCLVCIVDMLVRGSVLSAGCYLGAALILAALAIFTYLACFYMSKGIVSGTGWIFRQIKKSMVSRKEEAA